MARVLVCGSRYWTAREPIVAALRELPAGTTIIHGAARGADRIAGEVATELGFEVIACPADWDTHGKAAGPIRNGEMLRDHQPDWVLAFTPNLEQSRGTRDMVVKARRAGLPVKVVTE